MTNKLLMARVRRRPSDVGVMLTLTLGTVLGPALIIDLVALIQAGPH